jgi:calcineurin-like phosphoesterase family protein
VAVHFTSDLHLGHEKVADLRGFASTEEHDAALLERWKERVAPADVVWVLGDLCAGGALATARALTALREWPGRKRLVLGNHDRAHPMYRDAHRWAPAYASVFEWVTPAARTKVQGVEVLLSHFPYERDRGETRHAQWRLRDEGLPLLHGHTHGTERLTVTPPWRADRVEVHVGVDAWGLAPVSDAVVAAELREV